MLNSTASRLENYMTLLSVRQKLTAANIANADTPGYKTHGAGTPEPVEVQGLAVKNDGNNVSVDREARLLSENAIRFNLAARLLQTQIQAVRSALQEGRS
jgi:flagellar basal-body rod protein FlgB